jgi:hypothetical protein
VSINNLFAREGLDPDKVRAVTSGPAVNVYISLQGREPDGIVSRSEYMTLEAKVAEILEQLIDTNPNYTLGAAGRPVFEKVYRRPCLRTSTTPPSALAPTSSSARTRATSSPFSV